MAYMGTSHFNLNRILLLAIGLWPYQRSKYIQLQFITLFCILVSFTLFQLATFFTTKCTPDLVIKVFSLTLFFIAFIINYNSSWVNIQTIKCSFEQLQHICNELKDENEIAIIEKYGYNAKRFTSAMILISVCGAFLTFFLQMWPRVLDIVNPINKSRSRPEEYFIPEYFINQKSYLILSYVNAAFYIGITACIATGTMLMGYLKHACAMFSIASYRIQRAMTINVLQYSLNNDIIIYKHIVYAVDIHRKAIEFVDFLMTNFEGTFFFLIAVSVCCLSLNFFQIFRIASLGNDKDKLVFHLLVVIILLLYMFLANYIGQEITDHNNHVFSTAYNVCWYVAPLHIQKLILFLLQRGNKTFNVHIGGIFIASLKCFASLMSASISYFTVMYSTQQ